MEFYIRLKILESLRGIEFRIEDTDGNVLAESFARVKSGITMLEFENTEVILQWWFRARKIVTGKLDSS